jgi:hypothetical protein
LPSKKKAEDNKDDFLKIKVVMREGGADATDRGQCTMAGFSISGVLV